MCWRLFRFAFDEEFEERWQIFFAADIKAFSWVMQAGEKLYLKLMFVLASRDEALDRAKEGGRSYSLSEGDRRCSCILSMDSGLRSS